MKYKIISHLLLFASLVLLLQVVREWSSDQIGIQNEQMLAYQAMSYQCETTHGHLQLFAVNEGGPSGFDVACEYGTSTFVTAVRQ